LTATIARGALLGSPRPAGHVAEKADETQQDDKAHRGSVFLYAFDLIGLNGDDLRREPIEVRKTTLASALTRAAPGSPGARGRRAGVLPRLQDGPRRHRVEALETALPSIRSALAGDAQPFHHPRPHLL
jgi:hypothetical protein